MAAFRSLHMHPRRARLPKGEACGTAVRRSLPEPMLRRVCLGLPPWRSEPSERPRHGYLPRTIVHRAHRRPSNARRRDGERAPRAVLAMEHMEPLECRAAGSRFRDGGVEDFREVAEACGLALRWCPPATTAGVGAGSLPEMAGDTPESPPEFTWPLEAFADACPFVVELVLSADEAACTEPHGVL